MPKIDEIKLARLKTWLHMQVDNLKVEDVEEVNDYVLNIDSLKVTFSKGVEFAVPDSKIFKLPPWPGITTGRYKAGSTLPIEPKP